LSSKTELFALAALFVFLMEFMVSVSTVQSSFGSAIAALFAFAFLWVWSRRRGRKR